MEATKKNLIADKGSLFEFSARWTRDGAPVDLSDWEGALVVTTPSDTPLTLATAATELDDDGNITAVIAPEDLPAKGRHAYSLRLTAPGDTDPRFLLIGSFTVRTPGDA